MISYLIPFILTLAACFGVQMFALRAVGGRTTKSESNFFSSLGRIQAGAQGNAEVMVLGSSITGRLPDRAQGFPGVANMGCDGGSAVDALRAMDQGILPIAPWIIIEANTLHLALEKKPTEISVAMQKPWFKLGLLAPPVSAYARPAAFFYSKLLARKIGGFDLKPGEDLAATGKPIMIENSPTEALTPRQEELVNEVTAILGRLEKQGSKAMIVWLPPIRPNHSPPPSWILELAHSSKISYWDLSQQIAPEKITLTDNVHMSAPSAARTMTELMKKTR